MPSLFKTLNWLSFHSEQKPAPSNRLPGGTWSGPDALFPSPSLPTHSASASLASFPWKQICSHLRTFALGIPLPSVWKDLLPISAWLIPALTQISPSQWGTHWSPFLIMKTAHHTSQPADPALPVLFSIALYHLLTFLIICLSYLLFHICPPHPLHELDETRCLWLLCSLIAPNCQHSCLAPSQCSITISSLRNWIPTLIPWNTNM